MNIKRGDIFYADLNPVKGKEISKRRPVLIISNDINNLYSETVTVLPLTTYKDGKVYPFEVILKSREANLPKDSKVKANQIRTIDISRLKGRIGHVSSDRLLDIEKAVLIHLGINIS